MADDQYKHMITMGVYYEISPDDEKHYYNESNPVTVDTWISYAQQNLCRTTPAYLEALEHFAFQLNELLAKASEPNTLKQELEAFSKEKHDLLEFGKKHICPDNYTYGK